jgi:hypothetical protein
MNNLKRIKLLNLISSLEAVIILKPNSMLMIVNKKTGVLLRVNMNLPEKGSWRG